MSSNHSTSGFSQAARSDLDETAVHNVNDTVDGNGRLGNVGRHHDLAVAARRRLKDLSTIRTINKTTPAKVQYVKSFA